MSVSEVRDWAVPPHIPDVSLSLSHRHTDTQTASLASIMIWCPVLLRCHSNGSVIFVPRTKEVHFVKHCYPPSPLSPFSSVRWSSRWRRPMPSDGRSWREKDRSPTSNTSIRVSLQLLHLRSFPSYSPLNHPPVSALISPLFPHPPLISLSLQRSI